MNFVDILMTGAIVFSTIPNDYSIKDIDVICTDVNKELDREPVIVDVHLCKGFWVEDENKQGNWSFIHTEIKKTDKNGKVTFYDMPEGAYKLHYTYKNREAKVFIRVLKDNSVLKNPIIHLSPVGECQFMEKHSTGLKKTSSPLPSKGIEASKSGGGSGGISIPKFFVPIIPHSPASPSGIVYEKIFICFFYVDFFSS